MKNLIKSLADNRIDILASGMPLIFNKRISAKNAVSEVELFFITQDTLFAAGFPAAETIANCQKRQKGEIPGTEKLSETAPVLIE